MAPVDGSNTAYTAQKIIVRAEDLELVNVGDTEHPIWVPGDTQGSGINASTFSVTVHDLTTSQSDRTPAMGWSAPYATSASLTPALSAGHVYRATVSVSDNDGNQTTVTSDFKVLTSTSASTPTVSITQVSPDSYVTSACGSPQTKTRFTWNEVHPSVGASNITINASQHVGFGTLKVTLPASSIQVIYSIGAPGVAGIEQTSVFADVGFEVTSTGNYSATVPASTPSVGTITACLPATAIPSTVKLQLGQTSALGIGFRLCDNPLTGTLCTPDPIKSRFGTQEAVWGPWRDLKDLDYTDVPSAVAANLDLELDDTPTECAAPYGGSLEGAIQHLGAVLGTDDHLEEGVSLSEAASEWLARLADCVAFYTNEVTPVSESGPTDAQRATWLAAERDIGRVISDAPSLEDLESDWTGQWIDTARTYCARLTPEWPDTYVEPCAISVDHSGADAYLNAPGTGLPSGYVNDYPGYPVSVAVDFDGADYLDGAACNDNPTTVCVGLGSGSGGGIGILVEEGGGNCYFKGTGQGNPCNNQTRPEPIGVIGPGSGTDGAGYLVDLGSETSRFTSWGGSLGAGFHMGSAVGGLGFIYADGTDRKNYYEAYYGTFDIASAALGGVGLLINQGNADYRSVNGGTLGGGDNSIAVSAGGTAVLLTSGVSHTDWYGCTAAENVCLGSSLAAEGAPLGGLALLFDAGGANELQIGNDGHGAVAGIGATAFGEGVSAIAVFENGDNTYSCYATRCFGVNEGTFLNLGGPGSVYAGTATEPLVGTRGHCQIAWMGAKVPYFTPLGLGIDLCYQE